MMTKKLSIFSGALLLLAGFTCVHAQATDPGELEEAGSGQVSQLTLDDLRTFTDVFNQARRNYVEDVDDNIRPFVEQVIPRDDFIFTVGRQGIGARKIDDGEGDAVNDRRTFDFLDRHLDVRENVKLVGRQFAQWTHDNYPQSACLLAIEFKKFYMNEWSGLGDPVQIQAIRQALASTIPGIKKSLAAL